MSADYILHFREESTRLLEEIQSLKASLDPQTQSLPSPLKTSAAFALEAIVIEQVSDILANKLTQHITQQTKQTTEKLKELDRSSKKKISDALDQFRVVPSALSDASLARKIEMIGNLVRENFRENSARIEEFSLAEKRRLELEYQKKFDTYKLHIDNYVSEITDRFRTKEQEMQNLYHELSKKIGNLARHTNELSPEQPDKYSRAYAPLDEIYAADVPALQLKLRRLWTATEPSNHELLTFLDKLERAIFMGQPIDKIYEHEIRKCKDKLPLVQIKAKLSFFRLRGETEKLADLEIELANGLKLFEETWGESLVSSPRSTIFD